MGPFDAGHDVWIFFSPEVVFFDPSCFVCRLSLRVSTITALFFW